MLTALLGVCLVVASHAAPLRCGPKWLMADASTVQFVEGRLSHVQDGSSVVNPDNGYPKVIDAGINSFDPDLTEKSANERWNLWRVVQGSDEQQAASISKIKIIGIPLSKVTNLNYKSASGKWTPVSTSSTTNDTILLEPPIWATAFKAKPDGDAPVFMMDVYGCARKLPTTPSDLEFWGYKN